jgi:hypothetical protein
MTLIPYLIFAIILTILLMLLLDWWGSRGK